MNKNYNKNQEEVNSDICKSFRFMWDNFPHPVLLVQKNRTIIDANQSARHLGVPSGVKCRDISPYPDKCRKDCLADKALATGNPQRLINKAKDKLLATYWVPLHSVENGLYLHFVIDVPLQ
ncbi:MAG: hypothetical protein PHN98_00555 [Smithellaceae bacterium]|nr:hypothetical protein [Smithellaceae bacterium]